MNINHVISDEGLQQVESALLRGEHWLAYNQSVYFLDVKELYFFRKSEDAKEFARNNFSDHDSFQTMRVDSVADLLRRVSYDDTFHESKEMDKKHNLADQNPLYNQEGNAFTDALIEHIEKQNSIILKTKTMNTENLTYLKDNIKYMGFGESLNTELEKNIRENKADFHLPYKAEINQKPFEATLNFRKSDNSDMYFFNSYQAGLERKNKETMQQTFYLNKGKGITAKEAYNLLEGRSVHKELSNKAGDPYKAWVQLDFSNKDKNGNYEVKQYHENYGYDLKSAVGKFAVAEMDGAEKEKALMQSLQKGNIQSVNIENKAGTQKMFIEANPQFKTINLYDDKFKRVQKEALEQYHSVGQSQGKEMKVEQKKDLGQDLEKDKDQKKTKEQDVKQKQTKSKSRSMSM